MGMKRVDFAAEMSTLLSYESQNLAYKRDSQVKGAFLNLTEAFFVIHFDISDIIICTVLASLSLTTTCRKAPPDD